MTNDEHETTDDDAADELEKIPEAVETLGRMHRHKVEAPRRVHSTCSRDILRRLSGASTAASLRRVRPLQPAGDAVLEAVAGLALAGGLVELVADLGDLDLEPAKLFGAHAEDLLDDGEFDVDALLRTLDVA